ncbi:MAG: hypothetical protein AB1449_03495 [Chloroflexota bacterium]
MTRELIALASADFPIPAVDGHLLDELLQPRLALLWGTQAPTRTLLAAATVVAARGLPLRLFDGGNSFDGYFVARLARRLTSDPQAVLRRLRLSRAFTCFQLAELIENAPAAPDPLFVLDLLATFYDESVPLRDSERLLATTLTHLKRLAQAGPVIVGARPPRTATTPRPSAWGPRPGREVLIEVLETTADAVWLLRAPAPESPLQPRLFE